jgi:hypothetical protein
MSFFPGMHPGFGGAAAVVNSLSYLTSAQSALTTITIPATAQIGDLAVFIDAANTGFIGAPSLVTPSGWNLLFNLTLSTWRFAGHWKILTAGEPGANITGMAGGITAEEKIMHVFRPVTPLTLVTPSTWNSEATTGDPAAQNVVASAGTPALVVIGAWFAQTANVDPRSSTPALDQETSQTGAVNDNIWLGSKVYNSSPVDHSIDMDDEGTNALASGYLMAA